MSTRFVVVKTFPDESTALIARAVLDANGIPSMVSRDDAGGMLAFVRGIRLMVREKDAERAAALLAE